MIDKLFEIEKFFQNSIVVFIIATVFTIVNGCLERRKIWNVTIACEKSI